MLERNFSCSHIISLPENRVQKLELMFSDISEKADALNADNLLATKI